MAAPRIRILIGDIIALGPGKARLLEVIGETGSITAAARAMDMSYRRAWLLVDAMNNDFIAPLVERSAGGRGGGGSGLTDLGHEALQRYRRIEAVAAAAAASEMQAFQDLLKETDKDQVD
jgi:molybdate transport system regulatory protein